MYLRINQLNDKRQNLDFKLELLREGWHWVSFGVGIFSSILGVSEGL